MDSSRGVKSWWLSIGLGLLPLVILTGCMAFREAAPVESWPPQPAESKKVVRLVFSGGRFDNWRSRKYLPPHTFCFEIKINRWCNQNAEGNLPSSPIRKAFEESGLFSKVVTGEEDAEIQAWVKFISRGQHYDHLYGAITLFLIPDNAQTFEFVEKVTFTDRKGNVLGQYRRSEISQLWVHLIFLFVPPIWSPQGDWNGAAYDMTRAIILEARQKGII